MLSGSSSAVVGLVLRLGRVPAPPSQLFKDAPDPTSQGGVGNRNQSNHAGEHGLARTAYMWPGGGGHLRGERRESDRENERMIAMARKQREKDPRPRPKPPRTSQARHVAGIIVGPGSVVPGPLELCLPFSVKWKGKWKRIRPTFQSE